MKRTALVGGVLLAAIVFVPGTVSAQCYNKNGDESSNWRNVSTVSWHADNKETEWSKDWSDTASHEWSDDSSDEWASEQSHDWSNNESHDWSNNESHDWAGDTDEQTSGTIVDALASDGNFTTLVAAVKAAGLAETLSAPGDLTVFAPTDEAFAKLPAGTVEALLANPTALADVLKNHVVAGRVDGKTAVKVGEAQSLLGNTLNIGYGDDGELYIDDSRITMTDIHTSNGIVHVIDAVLVPKQ